MRLLLLAGNSLCGALSSTDGTTLTLGLVDLVSTQSNTFLSGALLLTDVSVVLIAEVTDGGQNGVGSGLTQAAQSAVLNSQAQLFQQLDVAFATLAGNNTAQDFLQTLGTDTAVDTLTAGLVLGEVQEELGHTHHAGGLVHNDHTAGAHDGAGSAQSLVVDDGVQQVSGDTAAGGAAQLHSLELMTVADAAGDTEDNDDVLSLQGLDIVFLPVNQPYTMTVEQAIRTVKAIKPTLFYPYHYGQVEEKTDIEALKSGLEGVCEVRVFPME